MKLEKTCKCILEFEEKDIHFYKDREYQVDIYPDYYKVYQNGGWYDYIYMQEEDFDKNFKLID